MSKARPGPWSATCKTEGCGHATTIAHAEIVPGMRCPNCYRVGALSFKPPRKAKKKVALPATPKPAPKIDPPKDPVGGE